MYPAFLAKSAHSCLLEALGPVVVAALTSFFSALLQRSGSAINAKASDAEPLPYGFGSPPPGAKESRSERFRKLGLSLPRLGMANPSFSGLTALGSDAAAPVLGVRHGRFEDMGLSPSEE